MEKSILKRFLLMILILVIVSAVFVPSAFCINGDESPDGTKSTDSAQPTDSATRNTFKMLMLESKGIDVIRVQMRLRDLGYFNYRATGLYYSMTQKAVTEFQRNNELDPDGRVGEMTYEKLFSMENLTRKPLGASILISSGPTLIGSASEYGELADWFEVIDPAFPAGTTVTITDFNTGKTFDVTRTGGANHADVETVDAKGYDIFLECFGGTPNWEKRSVLVTIGNVKYAASLFGNPSGTDTISGNGMAGNTCLYFSGSYSDVFGITDKEHQIMVLRAAGKPIEY
ncbi:MAG: peptidoglycan-binding protein [Christensenellales bacterium]|jgi:peptidoglycan hydrolase-like protein with peptidoglycan-binding domain